MNNKNYTTIKYSVSIEVEKSADFIFNHLTYDISKWWPEDFEGENSKLNDEFVFTSGEMHYSKNKVVELVPNKKLVWLVIDSVRKTDNFEWTGTKMIFELTAKGNKVLVEYTYNGVVLENEIDRLKQICDIVIKENLYNFLTTGKSK